MPVITVSIEASLEWFVAQDERSGFWVANCPVLKIAAEGKTYSELAEAIDDCLQALFSDLVSARELDQFLREHNWKLQTPLPLKPQARVRFDVPYNLHRKNARDLEAACC